MENSKKLTKMTNRSGIEFDVTKIEKFYRNQKLPQNLAESFTDELFPPNLNSLLALNEKNQPIDPSQFLKDRNDIDESNIEWKRASDIFPEFLLFEGKIEANDIKQGNLGNCYFLSALAALAEFPNLIYKIFKTKKVSENGLYEIAFFLDGEWRMVIVDDYIPINKETGNCAFAKPNGNELWVLILEKAWAKVNGGYLNIIGGFASEPLATMTGFSKRRVDTEEKTEQELWNIIKEADDNDNIMCCATKNNQECEDVNLVTLHAYTLIMAKATKLSDGSEIKLLKIRNPHGSKEWKGDYSDESLLWTEELNKIFGHEIKNQKDLNDGLFFISLADFRKYFKSVYICHAIYNSYTKSYEIPHIEISQPQVISLYLPKESEISISANAPYWRFNRHLKDKDHPISILLARITDRDILNQQNTKLSSKHSSSINLDNFLTTFSNLEFIDGDFCADDDPSIKTRLGKGFYYIWVFSGLNSEKERIIDRYSIKICANSRFISNKSKKINKMESVNFALLREILLSGIKTQFKNEIAADPKFGTVKNQFKSTGFGYYIKLNNTTDKFFKLTLDSSNIDAFVMLPPTNKKPVFDLFADPGHEISVFAMRTNQYGRFWYNIDISSWLNCEKFDDDNQSQEEKSFYKKKSNHEEKLAFLQKYFSLEINILKNYQSSAEFPPNNFYDYVCESSEEAKLCIEFEQLDINQIAKEQFLEEYPHHFDKVLKLPTIENDENLNWTKINFANGLYLGQTNDENQRHGRGVYIFNDGNFIVGQFLNNERNGLFEEYSDTGKLEFRGNYLKGKKNGKGIYYYDNGSYYDGEFKNDVRHGKGGYYFPSGQKYVGSWADNKKEGKGTYYYSEDEYWDGFFLNNEFHGEGVYHFSSGTTQNVTYKNGQQV